MTTYTEEDNYGFDYMKTNKDTLKNIIRDPDKIEIIEDFVIRTNKIVTRAYQFIKLYLIYQYENKIKFSIINADFMRHVYNALTVKKPTKKKAPTKIVKKETKLSIQKKALNDFYNDHYKYTIIDCEPILYTNLCNNLKYEAIDMITNINNNVMMNYINHLNRYVNIVFGYKAKMEQIKRDYSDKGVQTLLCKQWTAEIKKIKEDLYCFTKPKSDVKYHKWIIATRQGLYPYKKTGKNVKFAVDTKPQDYLVSMFYICTELEKMNDSQEDSANHVKLINVLPLRNSIIPKNICIDTCTLIFAFMGGIGTKHAKETFTQGNNQYNLWNKFFNLDKRTFKKGSLYKFHYMIRTDGVSCSILFGRLSPDGIPLKSDDLSIILNKPTEPEYIDKIPLTEELRHMKVVCADPGHSDLIYCAAHDEKGNLETFRYTQNQRQFETKIKKYNKIIDNLNKNSIIECNGLTVKENEIFPAGYNSKACSYERYKAYCDKKNKVNHLLLPHYTKPVFRKLKFNRFINTQKSESKLIKNFSNKFGPPSKAIFVIGDYSKGSYNMKGLEPAVCKKFRRIFRNAGYRSFLIDEFKTSVTCNGCHGRLETFLRKPSLKPKHKDKNIITTCHGLLRCQSNEHCSIIHNRDKNAAQNMLHIVKSVFETGERPGVFCRPSSNSVRA